MSRKMLLGTQHYTQMVRPPLSGADMSPEGWGADGTYLSGGAFVRQSQDSHRQYIFEWSGARSVEEASYMQALRDGVYSKSRRDLIYFIDPNIYDKNILPKRWAQPGILAPDSGSAPTPLGHVSKIDGPGVSGLPLTGAQVASYFTSLAMFDATTTPQAGSIWLPVPPGETLHLVAWTGDFATQESGLYVKAQNLDGSWMPAERVESQGVEVSGARGVLLASVGLFNYFGARAVIGRGDDWGDPAKYRWTGTPGASVSEKVVGGNVVARNLIHNGSFEYVDGFVAPLGWHGNYAIITTWSLSEDGIPHDYFFAPYGGVVGDRIAMAGTSEGETVYVSNTTPFPVTAGEWVGFGALVAVSSPLPEARIRVRFLDDNNAAVGGLAGTEYEYTVFPDGTEIIGAAQVPAGATRARVLVYAKENPPDAVIAYIDAVRADTAATEMEALNRVLHYFDGDTQGEAPTWSPGLGHSGCAFVGNPTWTPTSGVNGGQVGYAATLKEVGDWQQ